MNLDEIKEKNLKEKLNTRILVGMGSCGIAAGAKDVFEKLTKEVAERSLPVTVDFTGCAGYCHNEPTINIFKNGKNYLLGPVFADDVVTILETFIIHEASASKYLIPQNFENISLVE